MIKDPECVRLDYIVPIISAIYCGDVQLESNSDSTDMVITTVIQDQANVSFSLKTHTMGVFTPNFIHIFVKYQVVKKCQEIGQW